jgi:tetratricopeptide (TPR) repeat protein
LLDILRIPAPKRVSGRSLRAALNGQPIASRDCYAEAQSPFLYNHWSPLHTVISQRWKYINTTRPELYDLESDPGEMANLFESAAEPRQRMEKSLKSMQQAFVSATAQSVSLSEKDRANLQALGYVSAGPLARDSSKTKIAADLPDVKDMLVHLAQFERAKNISMEGRLGESIALLTEIVHLTDKFPAADLLLGDCQAQAGRLDEAVTTYRSVLAKRPDFAKAHLSMGKVFSSQGRLEQAEAEFREFLKDNPDAATCHFELGQVLAKMQKFEEAISEYREAIDIAPEFVVANISLGQLLAMLRRPQEATACFEQAIEYDPLSAAAHAGVMTALAQTGQFDKAIEHGRTAVALQPKSFDARFNLGLVLVAHRRYSDGIAEFRVAQKLQPDDPRPRQQIQRIEAALKNAGP